MQDASGRRPELEQYVKTALRAFMATKTGWCAMKAQRADLAQTVDVEVNGERYVNLIPDKAFISVSVASVQDTQGAKASRILHLADGYGYALPPEGPVPTVRPRDAFAAGNPNAFECLTAAGIDVASGELVQMSVRYEYKGNTPVFDEISVAKDCAGDITNALREAAK